MSMDNEPPELRTQGMWAVCLNCWGLIGRNAVMLRRFDTCKCSRPLGTIPLEDAADNPGLKMQVCERLGRDFRIVTSESQWYTASSISIAKAMAHSGAIVKHLAIHGPSIHGKTE